MQKYIAKVARKSAYLAEVPRLRGLALLVFRLAEDDRAASCATEQQVSAWFDDPSARFDAKVQSTIELLAQCKAMV